MLNRLIFLFIREKKFFLRFILIIVVIFVSLLLTKKDKAQLAQIEKLKKEKQLVEQIPEFKKQIAYLKNLEKEKLSGISENKEIEKEPILEGILVADNAHYAIIDNTTYQEGEEFGKYNIFKINPDSVILQDKNTKQTKTLYLYSPDLPLE